MSSTPSQRYSSTSQRCSFRVNRLGHFGLPRPPKGNLLSRNSTESQNFFLMPTRRSNMKMASNGRLVPSVGSFKHFCRTCRNRCGYFVAPRCLFWSSKVIMTNSNASDVFPPKDYDLGVVKPKTWRLYVYADVCGKYLGGDTEKHSRVRASRLWSACTQIFVTSFGHSARRRISSAQTFRMLGIWILST